MMLALLFIVSAAAAAYPIFFWLTFQPAGSLWRVVDMTAAGIVLFLVSMFAYEFDQTVSAIVGVILAGVVVWYKLLGEHLDENNRH